ncbi:MAG: hypothetical protein ABI806_11320 [Candidatus Solibacter sp.]
MALKKISLACLLITCLLITCLLITAAHAAPSDPWLKITSANFELYTTAGERSGRSLIRHFEQVRSFFLQAFGTRLAAARPARIIVFRSEKEYQPYRPNEFASAFFQPGATHDFIVMSSADSEHFPVAVHEYTHLMIHQSSLEIPAWLNEGLAELYSSLEPRGNKMLVGQVLPSRLQSLANDRWIPLPTLLAVDHNSPYYNEKSKAGMFYAESWALVHMLNLDPAYQPHLKDFISALGQGDPVAAMQRIYGKTPQQVEAALHTYFSGNSVHASLFDVQVPKNIDAPEISAGATLPARLALAELLSNNRGKSEQGREAYDQLAKDFPASCEVEDGRAQSAWHERIVADAVRHFARGVELGCKSQPSLLLYGRVLGYNNQLKEAAAVLTDAAILFPDSDEIHLELGATLVRTGAYGAAAAALQHVKKVATAADGYRLYYNLAYAQYRLADTPHARESIVKARKFTKNPEELASLDRLEQTLERPAARPAPPPREDSDEEPQRPRLQRRTEAEEPVSAVPQLPAVQGTLENMECGTLAKLHVRVDGTLQTFVIPDPTKVAIQGANGEPVELTCGPQKSPRALRLEYQAVPNIPGVAGLVRTLEFK